MREIKFSYLVRRHNGFVFSETFTLPEIEGGKAEGWMKANHVYSGDLHRRQFTGLCDKNVKEIYEGDIVKARGKDRRDEVVGHVVFSDGEYLVETTQRDWPMASVVVLEHFEIIGNIYENPTLLEAK